MRRFVLVLVAMGLAQGAGAATTVGRWKEGFDSAVAAAGCERALAAAAADDAAELGRHTPGLLEWRPRGPAAPQGELLARLCLLRAWTTLSATEPQRVAELLGQALALAAHTTVAPAYRDAVTLAQASWAVHAQGPAGQARQAIAAVAALSSPQTAAAAAVLGRRPQWDLPEVARFALERGWEAEGEVLTMRLLALVIDRDGGASVAASSLLASMARAAMAKAPQLAQSWGDLALALAQKVDPTDEDALALRISLPEALAVKAARLGQAAAAELWLSRARQQAARLAEQAATPEQRAAVVQAWDELAQTLASLGRQAEQEVELVAALRYAGSAGAPKARAGLLLQLATLHLRKPDLGAAADAVKDLTALVDLTQGAARTPRTWTQVFRSTHLPRLQRVLTALRHDLAPDAAPPPRPRPLLKPMFEPPLALTPGVGLRRWLEALGAADAYTQREQLAWAFQHIGQGAMKTAPHERALLAMAWTRELLRAGDDVAAAAVLADARWQPPKVGALWRPGNQAAWLQVQANLHLAQGRPAQADAALQRAFSALPPRPGRDGLNILYAMVRPQVQAAARSALQNTVLRMEALVMEPGLDVLRNLSLALARAHLLSLPGNDQAEAAQALLVAALVRYVAEPSPGPRGMLASQALMLAQSRPRVDQGAERVLVHDLLELLVALDDRRCEPDVRSASDHFTSLQFAKQLINGFNLPASWREQLATAQALSGDRSLVTELAVRAFQAGAPELAQSLYARLQAMQVTASDVLPRLVVSSRYAERELALIDTAAVERAMLSDKPEQLQKLLAAPWEAQTPLGRAPAVYGKSTAGERHAAVAAAAALPPTLLHVMAFAPMQRNGLCDEANLKETELVMFVTRERQLVAVQRLGSRAEFQARLARWMAQLRTGAGAQADSRALYDQVLAPALPLLGQISRLDVRWEPEVAEPPLSVLMQLHAPAHARELPIRFLPNAQTLTELLAHRPSGEPAAVLANADFGVASPGIAPVNALAWSGIEGQAVAELAQARLYQGSQASLLALLGLKQPSVLHISSHTRHETSTALATAAMALTPHAARRKATIPGDTSTQEAAKALVALTSVRLALANANQPGEGLAHGGRVSALLLAALDLRGTQLAVLSACDSAVSVDTVALAAPSLQWAMHRAGARAVLATLWAVDDEATTEFMRHFYGGLRRGLLPSVALAQAQTALRTHATRADWRAPRRWGAFTLSGIDEPIDWAATSEKALSPGLIRADHRAGKALD